MSKKYATLEDIAGQLQLKKDTIWRWSRKGIIPSIHLGDTKGPRTRRTLRFDPDEIADWIEKKKK